MSQSKEEIPTEEIQPGKKKIKVPPQDLVIPQPKPKLSKAERRALQEQQRAAKAAAQGLGSRGTIGTDTTTPSTKQKTDTQQQKFFGGSHSAPVSATVSPLKIGSTSPLPGDGTSQQQQQATRTESIPTNQKRKCSLVSHLPIYPNVTELFHMNAVITIKGPDSMTTVASHSSSSSTATIVSPALLHPAVIELGRKYATGQIRGGNARCRAMLGCYQQLFQDFVPVTGEDVRHVIDHMILKPAFQFWTVQCRPHSVSMGNAFSFLKTAVSSMERDTTWDEMHQTLQSTIQAYMQERIDFADVAIAELINLKVLSMEKPEILLTYGNSEAIAVLLQHAAHCGKNFRVIVVDAPPLLEGRVLLDKLRSVSIECSYIQLPALTYVLQDVTKVLLGAAALMSDGSIVGRVGSAVVAMTAHNSHIPVLICAETYKISNRVQLESITNNELGRSNTTTYYGNKNEEEEEEEEDVPFEQLNLMFDLTPATFVSGIVTELGIVPPSSVAVLLREMNPQELKSR